MDNQTEHYLKEELADGELPSGVESEDESEEEYEKHKPFNPDSISISSKVIALDTVLRRIKNNTIRLAPDFQRNFVWDKKRKSQLIESMILRIPLPMFYVSEDRDGIWEVVDGLQRLSTIRDFVLGPDGDGKGDSLNNLEFWNDFLKGATFFSLEKDQKAARILNNIMESQLSFTIINPDTPEEVKRNIFKRINTGGMRLSDQEIRHALYQGKATKLLGDLVKSDSYIIATQNTVKDSRMAGRELILRFLAFNMLGRENFKSSMDTFLSDTMRLINGETIEYNEISNRDINNAINDFKLGIERSISVFGKHAFRNSTDHDDRKAPINKALFELWINVFSGINDDIFSNILHNKSHFIGEYRHLLRNLDFGNAISRHGGSSSGSITRFNKALNLVNNFS